MAPLLNRISVLIAHAAESPWAVRLGDGLTALPFDVRWSQSDHEAIGLATGGSIHVGVFDDALPIAGGLDVVRRLRQLRVSLPCLLVCEHPSQRLLQDALDLDVYSVVRAAGNPGGIIPILLRAVRRNYPLSWTARAIEN